MQMAVWLNSCVRTRSETSPSMLVASCSILRNLRSTPSRRCWSSPIWPCSWVMSWAKAALLAASTFLICKAVDDEAPVDYQIICCPSPSYMPAMLCGDPLAHRGVMISLLV